MSTHPLVEVLQWTLQSVRDLKHTNIRELLVNAPKNYSQWWIRVFNDAPQHVLIETGLIVFIIWLLFIRKTIDPKKASKGGNKLKKEEIDWLVETWVPDPLVPPLTEVQKAIVQSAKTIEAVSADGKYFTIDNTKVLNFSSFDFLGMSCHPKVREAAFECLEKYGCGSCGPRGFYGTIDKHLLFEDAISKFMNTEEAICYSDSASTVSSSIPAFAKKGDLLIVDDACNEAIMTGAKLSRSTVRYFRHNDMEDLANVLESIAQEDRARQRDATQQRRFIVVEGIYRNRGDLCPLPQIMTLKRKYCYRLILDEGVSFGTLGKTGRGVTEYFNIDSREIEIIDIPLDTTLGSIGGVCVGTRAVVDHQRLSGAGYCFSASAPPFLSAAALTSLELMLSHPEMLVDLKSKSLALAKGLDTLAPHGLVRMSSASNELPLQYLMIKDPKGLSIEKEELVILDLVDRLIKKGLGVSSSKEICMRSQVRPSVRLTVSTHMSEVDIKNAIQLIGQVWEEMRGLHNL